MRMRYEPRIFLSVSQALKSARQNEMNHTHFKNSLKVLKVHALTTQGVYNNVTEQSFLLSDTPKNRNIALQAMELYKQECILIMDEDGIGRYLYNDGTMEKLGRLKVTPNKPVGVPYTYVYETNDYITFV